MNSTDAKQFDLPQNGTSDHATLEQVRRGLCQQAEGLKQQLQGVRQQISAIDRHLNGGVRRES